MACRGALRCHLQNRAGQTLHADRRVASTWPARIDPIQPVGFLLSSHSAKTSFCKLECYKAAAGSLTLSATSRHFVTHPQSRHCPKEVVRHIEVVILITNIPNEGRPCS